MTSNTGNSKVDLELKKAFQDLQSKMVETTQKLRQADYQAEVQRQLIKRAELTKSELQTLPEKTPTYESVGRMFIKQDMTRTLEQVDRRIAQHREKIASLEAHKMYLEKSIQEEQSNLRDLVQAKKTSA